jgi:MFS family permease
MQLAIPNFNTANYGLVAGPFFSLIFGTLVLFTGSLADKFNRRFLLGFAAVAWSITSLGTAVARTFS